MKTWYDKDIKKPKDDSTVLVTWEGTIYIADVMIVNNGQVKFVVTVLDTIVDARYWMPLPAPAKES